MKLTAKQHMLWRGWRNIEWENVVVMSTIPNDEVYDTLDGTYANLPLFLEEVNHSPTGFEWGYRGSGPSQLAYAILRTFFEHSEGYTPEDAKQAAQANYMRFKDDVVCNRFGRSHEWVLFSYDVYLWLQEHQRKEDSG